MVGMGLVAVACSCGSDGASRSADDAARSVIEDQGVDASASLSYEHFFYFGDESPARAAADDLGQRGFTVEVLPPDQDIAEWSVVATHDAALDDEEFDELLSDLTTLAERHGGEYDGWGTPL
jgi:regulator of RNase E activity RraB